MTYFNRVNFNELTDVDQSIYAFISNNIDKVPYMRVREIAKESHTSASSVMRFIRKIGYEGYNEFRLSLKTDEESINSNKIQKNDILNINNFSSDLYDVMGKVAETIVASENIIFFGMGASGAMCEYAARRLATIGYNANALNDPTFPLYQKLKNTAENVVIVLSITGNTVEIVEAVNGYKNLDDFQIVSITGDVTSNLANLSDFVLSYKIDTRHLFRYNDMTSQLPTIFIVEELIDTVMKIDGEYN